MFCHGSLDTFLVFTDGACEGDERKGGIGGVLVNEHGQCVHHFSYQMPDEFMALALSKSDNPIYELELLPTYVAWFSWEKFSSSVMLCFTWTMTLHVLQFAKGLVPLIWRSALSRRSWDWKAVWSSNDDMPGYLHLNISDDPSRMDCSEVLQLGSTRTEVDLKRFLEDLLV